jgi:hypothetical protein
MVRCQLRKIWVREEWHLLKLKTVIASVSAAEVAQGCAVYGPEDGISNLVVAPLTKRLDPLLP